MAEVTGQSIQVNLPYGAGQAEVTGQSVQVELLPLDDSAVNGGGSVQIQDFCFEIVDGELNPVEDAIVVITASVGVGSVQINDLTDADGKSFTGILSGVIDVSKPLYSPASLAFDFSVVAEGDCIQIIITEQAGMSSKVYNVPVISIPKEVPAIDFDFAGFTCDYIEYVFGNSADEINNDKSSFLLKKALNTDTIVFELWKGDEKKQDITDDSLGEFYNGFDVQPLYVGAVVYWGNVLSLYGFGQYTIRATQNIAGQETTFTSRMFQIISYSAQNANNTVRIETYQQGYILNSDFDYRDLLPDGWYQSFRIYGRFGSKTPLFESEPYLSENRTLLQNQDKIVAEYTLELETLPSTIHNQLIYDNMLANEVLITDCNVLNTEKFERVSLYPKSIEEPELVNYRTRLNQVIKLVEKEQRTVKRNF
jgi:hypothetical protein